MKVSHIFIQLVAWVVGWYIFLFISPLWFFLSCWNFITGNAPSNLLSEEEEIKDVANPIQWGNSKYIQLKVRISLIHSSIKLFQSVALLWIVIIQISFYLSWCEISFTEHENILISDWIAIRFYISITNDKLSKQNFDYDKNSVFFPNPQPMFSQMKF